MNTLYWLTVLGELKNFLLTIALISSIYECLSNNKGYIRRWLYIDDLLKGGKK